MVEKPLAELRTEAEHCLVETHDVELETAAAIRLAELAHLEPELRPRAIELAAEALERARHTDDHGLLVRAFVGVGNAQFSFGTLESAEQAFAQAYRLARDSENRRWLAVAAKDLGITVASLGRPEEAVRLLEEARTLRPWWPSAELEIPIEGNLASVWLRLDSPDLAEVALERALKVARERQDPREIVDISLRLAGLWLDRHEPAAAISLLDEVEPLIDHQSNAHNDRDWHHGLLGAALLPVGRGEDAIVVLRRRVEHVATMAEAPWRLPIALVDLAVTLVQVRGPSGADEAFRLLEQARATVPTRDRGFIARLSRGHALVTVAGGSQDQVVAALETAIAAQDELLARVPSPRQRRRWGEPGRELRELLALELFDRRRAGDLERLFEVLEEGRAQELAGELAAAGLPHLDEDPRVAELLESLVRLEAAPGAPDRDQDIRALEVEIDSRRAAQRQRLGERYRVSLDAIHRPSLAEVLQLLDPGVAIISLDLVRDRLLLGVLSASGFEVALSPATLAVLTARREALHELLDTAAADPILRRLGADVIDPVAGALPEVLERIVLVPSGALQDLPFDLLSWRDQPLGEIATIEIAPSVATWLHLRGRAAEPRPSRGLVVAHSGEDQGAAVAALRGNPTWEGLRLEQLDLRPIPGAVREARAIRRRFPTAELWLDQEASETRLKTTDFGVYGWLHVASHGLASGVSPARSSLWLEPGGADDGLLRAREISALPLGVRLVVLSACRTAQRPGVTNDGVDGLARAFLAAGASAVIASLREVDDSATAVLMEQLYRELGRGRPPAEALRLAKLDAARRGLPRTSWSAFVLFGAGNQPLATAERLPALRRASWIAALVVAVAMVYGVRRWFVPF